MNLGMQSSTQNHSSGLTDEWLKDILSLREKERLMNVPDCETLLFRLEHINRDSLLKLYFWSGCVDRIINRQVIHLMWRLLDQCSTCSRLLPMNEIALSISIGRGSPSDWSKDRKLLSQENKLPSTAWKPEVLYGCLSWCCLLFHHTIFCCFGVVLFVFFKKLGF